MLVTTRFDQIKRTRKVALTCKDCGAKRTRQRTFMQTRNRFNTWNDGCVKTPREVRGSVEREAQAWEPDLCATCELKLTREAHNAGVKAEIARKAALEAKADAGHRESHQGEK